MLRVRIVALFAIAFLCLGGRQQALAVGFTVDINQQDTRFGELDPQVAVSGAANGVVLLNAWGLVWDVYNKSGAAQSTGNRVLKAGESVFDSGDPCNDKSGLGLIYKDSTIAYDPDGQYWAIEYLAKDDADHTSINNHFCMMVHAGETAPTESSTWYGVSVQTPGGWEPYCNRLAYYHGYFYGSVAEYPGNGPSQKDAAFCEYDPAAIVGNAADSYACGTRGLHHAGPAYAILPLPIAQDGASSVSSTTGEIFYFLRPPQNGRGGGVRETLNEFHIIGADFTAHRLERSPETSIATPWTIAMPCPKTSGNSTGVCGKQPRPGAKLDTRAENGLSNKASYNDTCGKVWLTATVEKFHTGMRYPAIGWWAVTPDISGSTVSQSGIIGGGDAEDRYNPSIEADKSCNVAITYTKSDGKRTFPSIEATGRLSSDTPDTMETETTLDAGTDYSTFNINRWGEIFQWGLDPSDDCWMWGAGLAASNHLNNAVDNYLFSAKWPGC